MSFGWFINKNHVSTLYRYNCSAYISSLYTIFQLIWNQTDVHLEMAKSIGNGKYILIWKRFPCVIYAEQNPRPLGSILSPCKLIKLYFHFLSNWMGYDRGDSFPFSILNWLEFRLAYNQNKNCDHIHIPLDFISAWFYFRGLHFF